MLVQLLAHANYGRTVNAKQVSPSADLLAGEGVVRNVISRPPRGRPFGRDVERALRVERGTWRNRNERATRNEVSVRK